MPTFDPLKQPLDNNGRFWNYLQASEASRKYNTNYWDNKGNKVMAGITGDDSRVIMDRVIPFINNAVDKNIPFFSVVWFHTPHLPCVAGPEHASMYVDYILEEKNYYGCITAMDEQIARLVNYLQTLDMYDNTIILFCSDNGPELNTPGSAGNLRGMKRLLYEGGIRVPAFMMWCEKLEGVRSLDLPCSTSDYLPTLAEVLGIRLQTDRELDGFSFWSAIENENTSTIPSDKEIVFCSDRQVTVITEQYKLYYANSNYELYDIKKDPTENNNLIEQDTTLSEKLKKSLDKAMSSYRKSFEGNEYGKESYNKVPQKWHDIMR